MEENKAHILVVDDEEDICEILQFNLEKEGYIVDVAYSAEEALKLKLEQYNLIMLDVMMGEISGFKMAKMMKGKPEWAKVPIIFITAKDTENDTITGLTLGADDYISKPFSLKEVTLRVAAVLRRIHTNAVPDDRIAYHDLVLDTQKKSASLKDEELVLTKKEYDLLKFLLTNQDEVFSREDILDKVWEEDKFVTLRTIDVNITRLRKKIGEYGSHIVTRWGFGYCFES
jgi:two-component system alkaline phosphatase synthesis response regulator PhoP